ncbi:hypothetical protein Tco_0228435 [Tanacetum coccineum]
MRTRNSYFPNNSNVTILRRRNKGRAPNIVEPKLRTIVVPMAERTMEELLRAPMEGITSTLRFRNVPNDVIKLMMFPYSLEGAAKTWYDKEPPNSILTWEDLVTKFGVAYEGPSIPTNPSPKKVVERETEETTDKEQTNFQGSTAQIPPPVIPISIPEPNIPKSLPKTTPIPESDIPKNLPKLNIPYPSH